MLSWANAEEFCEADGGGLISLNTRMKNSFIANVLVGKYGYISAEMVFQNYRFKKNLKIM